MPLTFYYHPLSQPSRAVLALLNIGHIPFEPKIIDLFKGEQRSPEYRKISPFGTVPCLVDEDLTICQSNAILIHLCETFANELGSYQGSSKKEKAIVNQYLSWYQGTFRPSLISVMRTSFACLMKNEALEGSVLSGLHKKMSDAFDFLDARLTEGGKYICGNQLTIADLLIFHEATNVQIYKYDISKWKNVQAWYDLVQQNQAVKAIHTKFREGLPAINEKFANLQVTPNYSEVPLTFYLHPVSQPCRAVMALLAIGKIKYEEKLIDIFDGSTRKPEFLEINPFGSVPFIIHGDQKLAESNAILAYLCEVYPDQLKGYYGATIAQRALVNELLSWYQAKFRPALLQIIHIKFFKGFKQNVPITANELAEGEKTMIGAIELLQSRLAKGNPYLCGKFLSIADLLYFSELTNIEIYKFDISKWQHVKIWYERVLENEVVNGIHQKFRQALPPLHQLFDGVKVVEQ